MELDQIRHKLSLFIDGQLNPEENEEVRKLIESDSVWREEHQKLVNLEQMAERFEIKGDDKYWDESRKSILDKIDRAESEKIITIKPHKRRSDIYKLVAVAASMALVIFISIYETDELGQIEELFSPQESAKPAVTETDLKRDTPSDISTSIESESREKSKAPAGKPEDVDTTPTYQPAPGAKISLQERDDVVPTSLIDQIHEEIVPVVPSSIESPILTGIESSGEMIEQPTITQPAEVEFDADSEPDVVPSAVLPEPVTKIRGAEKKIQSQMNSTGKVALEQMAESTDDAFYMAMPDKMSKPIDTTQNYSFWKSRVDSLETEFYILMSDHYAEDAGRDESKSVSDFTEADYLEMAEAFYMVGRLTDNEKERKTMIARLQKLAELTESDAASKIDEYLNYLVQ